MKEPVKLDGAKGGVSKHYRPRTPVRRNPDTVTEVSSSIVEFFLVRKRESRGEKVHTVSSVLSGKGKATRAITDKKPVETIADEEPLETSYDIDAQDIGDQFAVVDYVQDLYKFYKLSENSFRPRDYMGSQVEINEEMRAVLADRLIQAHHKFKLTPETLYLTFCIIDRYLSLEMVSERELQLVGVAAMVIAWKYEENRFHRLCRCVHDFIHMSERECDREGILAKEKAILDKLEWNLTVPTPYVFLVRFLKAAFSDKEMENMAFFLAELGLMQYSMITFLPSMIAASAVYAARCTLGKAPFWTEMLKHHTGFSEPQLGECAKFLVKFHSSAAESGLKVVYGKYSSPEHCAVALRPPAIKFLER